MMTEVTTPTGPPHLDVQRTVKHAGSIPQMCPHVEPALPGIGFILHKHKSLDEAMGERDIRDSGEADCTSEQPPSQKHT